jgi:CrcB protein
MMTALWIALGSALGGAARYGVGLWTAATLGDAFPWGTLIVNVVGSFVIGLVSGPAWSLSNEARLFLTVGVCGGFTTFSAFSIQTVALIQGGQWLAVAANVAGSVALCLIAVWAGVAVGAAFR